MSQHEGKSQSYAYEILGVLVARGYAEAHLEILGGGALGVTIPLSEGRSALITWDLGLFVELADFAETGEYADIYRFEFNEEDEFTEPLWLQTSKALVSLESYLYGGNK